MNTPTATILINRQAELNKCTPFPAPVEVYLSREVDLHARLSQDLLQNDDFWAKFVLESGDTYSEDDLPQKIELQLLSGIPANLRCAVYFRVFNIQLEMESHMYESLAKKAKLADFEGGVANSGPNPSQTHELIQIYDFCLNGSKNANTQALGILSPRLVNNLASVLSQIENIAKPEVLTIMYKLTELFSHVSRSEFSFKGSRAIEDLASETFVHVTKQGISVSGLFDTLFERVLDNVNGELRLLILDLVLFEGLDSLIRLIGSLFDEKKNDIFGFDGDELNEYLYSEKFISGVSNETIEKSLELQIPLINLKLKKLQGKFMQLQKTHEEISSQNAEYASKLTAARDEKEALISRKEALQQKYNQLTMQENLSNTIKANRDISAENQSLEEQIETMRKKVEAKTKLVA
ncbi:hypothetical protein HF325_003977 [Metschnikowia pulcherrima]|uniref:Uncharacterized protein n=1 Tax=Metschnikowia pulcherrima TaxID=27326 RepID=A0A8H7GS46_9ASCO|nr:hypothetical protein HF325_003977 [Metschnikowia pulcherrima]